MSQYGRIIGPLIAGFICLAVLAVTYYFLRDNAIGRANRLKEHAEEQYFAREYLSAYKTYRTLMDSTGAYGEAVMINYANAAFMSSNILKGGFYGRGQGPQLSDTILNQIASESQIMYNILTTGKNRKIASMAYNQLGYSAVKSSPDSEEANADSVLLLALQNFRHALKQNPNNDSARYNYELLKKVLDYPETIMNQTKALVAQKRYVEAANLLEASMERDVRLSKQKEYLQRLKAVAGIDTTYRKRI